MGSARGQAASGKTNERRTSRRRCQARAKRQRGAFRLARGERSCVEAIVQLGSSRRIRSGGVATPQLNDFHPVVRRGVMLGRALNE